MYSTEPNIIVGFHGCSKDIGLRVLNGEDTLIFSHNNYDWLGDGVYFWENDPLRAEEFAVETKKEDPFVLGAAIHLGYCLDLTQKEGIDVIRHAYENLIEDNLKASLANKEGKRGGITGDLPLRFLDCAVIRAIHSFNEAMGYRAYDSVKAAFWEGAELYPTAGFREKNHIQLCIRNPHCILGYFLPNRKMNLF